MDPILAAVASHASEGIVMVVLWIVCMRLIVPLFIDEQKNAREEFAGLLRESWGEHKADMQAHATHAEQICDALRELSQELKDNNRMQEARHNAIVAALSRHSEGGRRGSVA